MKEATLHEHVWSIFKAHGRPDVVGFHVPNGEKRDGWTAARLARMGTVAGVPDFVFIVGGRVHFLELKTATGRLSRAQEDFAARAHGAGATYTIARSIDEACGFFNAVGACRSRLLSGAPARAANHEAHAEEPIAAG